MSWQTVALFVALVWPLAILAFVVLWHYLMRKPPIDVELHERVTNCDREIAHLKDGVKTALGCLVNMEREVGTVKASLNLKTFGRQ